MQHTAADPKKSFGELVRARRREKGLRVPPAAKILPFVRPVEPQELDREQIQQLKAGMPLAVAEQRMQEAWWALGAASVQGVSRRQLSTLEEAYTQALTSYETSHHVRPDHGRGDVSELRYLGTLMGGRRDTEVDS